MAQPRVGAEPTTCRLRIGLIFPNLLVFSPFGLVASLLFWAWLGTERATRLATEVVWRAFNKIVGTWPWRDAAAPFKSDEQAFASYDFEPGCPDISVVARFMECMCHQPAALLIGVGHGGTIRTTFPEKGKLMQPERRRAARFPFTATAEIIDEKQDARSPSKVTDLSLHGCYVEMTNPLPQGTNVLIEIYTETEFLEAPATVAYFDPQQGMGLTFGEMHAYFASVLNGWLEKVDGRIAS